MAEAMAERVRRVDVRWRGRDALAPVGGAVLGLVLLFAAVAKSLDPGAFGEEIAGLGLAGPLPPLGVALFVLALEALLGVLLVANVRRLPVMIAATLLVGLFLFVTGRSAWRAARGIEDPASACGCFGNLVDRTPAEAFRQDLLMLVPALALAWLARPGATRGVRARVVVAVVLALAVGGFAAAAPALPLDELATRLRPGTELAEVCAGRDAARVCLADLAPALATGTHLVVIADPDGEAFLELGRKLNEYTRADRQPPVAVLADVTPERHDELYWKLAPAFELHETPRALLRPLYRSLPRSFRVEQGRVTATWAGLPPELAGAGGR